MTFGCQIVAALLTTCLLLSGCAVVIVPANDPGYFPMTEGTQWRYEAHSVVCQTGGVIVTNDAVVACDVLGVYAKEAVTAALLRGFPLGSGVWAGCSNVNEDSLLVCIPGSQYHLVGATVASRFADTNDFLRGLVSEDSLFLDCPLAADKRFGEFEQLARADLSYCWHVVSEERCRIRGVKGVSPWRPRIAYQVEYRTLPDFQSIIFVPGIGIVEYVYHHNGTPCDVRMRLIAFKKSDRREYDEAPATR